MYHQLNRHWFPPWGPTTTGTDHRSKRLELQRQVPELGEHATGPGDAVHEDHRGATWWRVFDETRCGWKDHVYCFTMVLYGLIWFYYGFVWFYYGFTMVYYGL